MEEKISETNFLEKQSSNFGKFHKCEKNCETLTKREKRNKYVMNNTLPIRTFTTMKKNQQKKIENNKNTLFKSSKKKKEE